MKFKVGDFVYSFNGPYDDKIKLVVDDTNEVNKIQVSSKENNIEPDWYKEDYFEFWSEKND